MKILVISDSIVNSLYTDFKKEYYQDIDCVISCGDLPLYYLNFIIDSLNVPCFYVPGNHDKYLETTSPNGWIALHENIVEFNGYNIAGIGGSPFYNGESKFQFSEYQIYWKYLKLKKKKMFMNKKVDIFVSHAPAYGFGDIYNSNVHQGFKTFVTVLDNLTPKLFLYGHAHLNYGVKRFGIYNQTLLINGYKQYIISWDEVNKAINSKVLKKGIDGELIEF